MGRVIFPVGVDAKDSIVDTLNIRSGRLSEGWFDANDRLVPDNIVFEQHYRYAQPHGAAITAKTEVLFIATGIGRIVAVEAVITGVVPGADTITVDIQRSTAGGAFATILSSVITMNSGNTTIRVPRTATINSSLDDYIDSDVFLVIVTASGSTAQGINVTVTAQQDPAT